MSGTTEQGGIHIPSIDENISQIGMNSNQAVSNKGLYFVQDNKIFYYDFGTQKTINWCTLANCNHENKECSGYIGEDLFLSKYLFFHESHIYKISKDENGAYLEQYNEDGSNQVRIGKLWDKNSYVLEDKALISTGCVKMDHGKVYFLINDDYKTIQFCSMELKAGARPQVISEYGEGSEKVSAGSFMISDGFAGFSVVISGKEERQQYIHIVNLEDFTDESYRADIAYFGMKGDNLIYADPQNPEDLISYNIKTKETKKILDLDVDEKFAAYYNNIICTKEYILLDNEMERYYGALENKDIEHSYTIYDYDGVCIGKISAEQYSLVSFDGRFLTAFKPGKTIELYINLITNKDNVSEWTKLR